MPFLALAVSLALSFPSESSSLIAPPDAAGAVGPHHVVAAYNTGIVVQDRNGAVLQKTVLARFWGSIADPGAFYDPRVVYDAKYDRWVVMSILDERQVMLAISESGDPTGAWRRYSIDERYADFSQLVLTGDSIVLGTIYWPAPHSIFFVIPREETYAHPEQLHVVRVPIDGTIATPVATESNDEIIVTAGEAELSWRTLDPSSTWQTARAPEQWMFAERRLPQQGGYPLEGSSGIVENAVEHNGWIYAVMTRRLNSTRNAVLWCRVSRATNDSEWGAVTNPDASYGYPSIAVNRAGAMVIGFGVFSWFFYASSGYVYRSPFGVTTPPQTLVEGDATAIAGDRWGDYTTTVVDPVDGSFWTLQLHARKGVFWETAWGHVDGAGRRRAVGAR
ncbi:MAG TPA: hypothetical protein VND45_01535 [Thermoanaerobaculia bacterium]|jgi:hypothetical protein|nr:hypothetical protein [Thermoanaerobaculia bacterium]